MAEDLVVTLKNHLDTFEVSLNNDIIAATQDGAGVNRKFICLTNVISKFCINHTIHLAVVDTLHKQDNDTIFEYTNDELYEVDNYDDAIDLEARENIDDENIDYHNFLLKSRKVTKFIKNSMVHNYIFQEKVKQKYRHEIELQLDVKARWNSTSSMILLS